MKLRWPLYAAALVGIASCSKDDKTEHGSTPPPSIDYSPDLAVDAASPIDAGAPLPLGACAGPPGTKLRTLIVGNSQIYYWDLPRLLTVLSQSGPPECPRIEAEGFTSGGDNLKRLWERGDSKGRELATTIRDGKYDVVLISESIDLVDLPPPKTQYVTFAKLIIDAARASHARPVLYASPYVDQRDHAGFVEMATPQIELGLASSVTVAAAGLAWLRVWKELPSLFLHHTDHSHPGYKGSMISAMVIYAAITRATPIGLTTAPAVECYGKPCPSITTEEGEIFQRAAWEEAQATGMK